MKKKSIVFLAVAFLTFLIMPFKANATTPVTVYFFRGDGCSYCAAAESFFESLQEDDEYKDLFTIKDFEVWYNDDNADFAEDVADAMGDTLGGVPYIIIGDESWNGYTSSYDDEIKAKIKEIADDDDFVDPLAEMVANYEAGISQEDNNSLVSIAILVGVVVIIGVGLYFARRGVESEDKLEEKENKKEMAAEKKTEPEVKEDIDSKEKENTEKAEEKNEEQLEKKETAKKTETKQTTVKKNSSKKSNGTKKTTNNKKSTTKKKTN